MSEEFAGFLCSLVLFCTAAFLGERVWVSTMISRLYTIWKMGSRLTGFYFSPVVGSDVRCCLDVVSLIRDVCQIITHGAGKMLGRLLNRHITKVPMTDSDIRAVVA